MKRNLISGILLLASTLSFASYDPVQESSKYRVQVDIVDLSDDEVSVTVVPPVMNADTVVYALPKIIPGTYDISDFGQFVRNLKAFDSMGEELKVERLDDNRWAIYNGKDLYKITYSAVDTEEEKGAGIFLPGGTAIKEDAIMLNAFGFVGFMVDHDKMPYEVEVVKGNDLKPTTTLDIVEEGADKDRFYAKDYFELHDRPILYSAMPNASVMVAGAEVTVGVYSPSGNFVAQDILDEIKPVFEATAAYLGGELPTDRYAVLLWGRTRTDFMQDGAAGALEHFTSTTMVMPDFPGLEEEIRHITAHEFFHIITPLNIHSQHIHDYDFLNPQMSAHLWFYEGVTEYNSLIAQVRGGVMTEEDFLDQMLEKMTSADGFNEYIPMTIRSEHALGIFADQYLDVYSKGALIGMALDMYIRKETDGAEGLVDLQIKLKNMYGPDTFFVDDKFFDIIIENTPEGTENFLYEYIAGTTPLPFEEMFDAMGYNYTESEKTYSVANPDWNVTYISSRSKYYIISNFDEEDAFTAGFGLQKGDKLKEWNGERVKGGELNEVLAEWRETAAPGSTVEIEVIRTDADGDEDELILTSTASVTFTEKRHILEEKANPTSEELALRNSWLKQ
ncbi:MAG: hypothetical protein HWE14_06325 [Flavobacteriia bacterium]|nr:hypothetical protein [Flavobacteriia bacterium]